MISTKRDYKMIEIRDGRAKMRVLELNGPKDVKSKITFLFVHGSCASMEQYLSLMDILASEGHRCVAYDVIGCGGSEKPDGWYQWKAYNTEELLLDLDSFVKIYANPDSANILVGHSYGKIFIEYLDLYRF